MTETTSAVTLPPAEPSGSHRTQGLSREIKPAARGWIHATMFPLTAIAGIVLVIAAHGTGPKIACGVFVATALMLFGTSATYHLGHWREPWAGLLRRLDHSNIALIIAGTYTPLAVGLFSGLTRGLMLGLVWGGALAAILMRVLWLDAPRWSYVPIYIALGWVALGFIPQLLAAAGPSLIWLLLAGGIAYTAGAVVYGLKWPNPWPRHFGFHEIFHSCTVIGFTCHFIAVTIAVTT